MRKYLPVLFATGLVFTLASGRQTAAQAPAAQPSAPAIKVTPNYKVEDTPNEPGQETATSYVEWEATNCEYVLIIGHDSDKYPCKGRVDLGGSFIFVVVGPGGRTYEFTGASLSMKQGPGRHGIVYNFDKEFNSDVFFSGAYKDSFRSNRSPSDIADEAVRILQSQKYTADNTKGQSLNIGSIVYTVNFNPNDHLKQTDEQRKKDGQIERQIAYVVLVRDAGGGARKLYILPVVKRNFPHDNKEWAADPDGLQLGIAPSQELAQAIIAKCKS